MSWTRCLGIMLLVVAMAMLSATPALAGKGGKGGNGGKGHGGDRNTASATIEPSCNPCDAGTVVHFDGAGYDSSQGKAPLDINGAVTSTMVFADGTISFDWPYFNAPGAYSVKAFQEGKGHKLVLMAQVTVTVQ